MDPPVLKLVDPWWTRQEARSRGCGSPSAPASTTDSASTPAFSWIEYPDKATRDAASEKMNQDSEMANMEMPFDGWRMFSGGFEQVVN